MRFKKTAYTVLICYDYGGLSYRSFYNKQKAVKYKNKFKGIVYIQKYRWSHGDWKFKGETIYTGAKRNDKK